MAFPCFTGTIEALRLPAVRPAALRSRRLAVPRCHRRFRISRRGRWRRCEPGVVIRYPRPAICRGDRRISQVPGEPSLSFAHDPGTPDGRLGPHLVGPHRVAPAGEKTKAPTMMVISGLNSMAFEIAVYASQPGLPQNHARLASRCWLDFPGQASPAGSRKEVSNLLHARYPPLPSFFAQLTPPSPPGTCRSIHLPNPDSLPASSWGERARRSESSRLPREATHAPLRFPKSTTYFPVTMSDSIDCPRDPPLTEVNPAVVSRRPGREFRILPGTKRQYKPRALHFLTAILRLPETA